MTPERVPNVNTPRITLTVPADDPSGARHRRGDRVLPNLEALRPRRPARSRLTEIDACLVTKDQLASPRTKPGVVKIRQTPAIERHPNLRAARAGVAEAGRDPGVGVEMDDYGVSVVTSILPLSREDREVHRCGEMVFRLGWQGAVSSRVGLALARALGARRSV